MDLDSPLKRCSSAPIIPNRNTPTNSNCSDAAGAGTASHRPAAVAEDPVLLGQSNVGSLTSSETPPAPNIFSRTRRYSASSFSPLAASSLSSCSSSSSTTANSSSNGAGSPLPSTTSASGLRLTPRVSQLRQEECADMANANIREVNHERGLHNQLQISQSWEDLTIVTENWSCRDDLTLTNPLLNCSSPSPTSSRHGPHHPLPFVNSSATLRYPFGMSPSPTRKTFATRRSMSPNHVQPSQLCPVKRKFDMDESCGGGSPPPHKKMFLDVATRGSSPIHSLPICPSPDSGTYMFEGRTTPKLFISKLCSSNSLSSFSSASASPTSQLEMGDGETATKISTVTTGTSSSSSVVGSRSSSGSSSAATDAKEQEEGEEGVKNGNDHQMLDLSREICDRMEATEDVDVDPEEEVKQKSVSKATETNESKEVEKQKQSQVANESEVDDGIGEEEAAPNLLEKAKEPEQVVVVA